MSKCKFTIITVCYNAKEHIATTVQSVLSQSYENFEYIIKDGQSCDGTMDIVHNLTDSDNRVMIIQGKDQGIYDAMNTAVLQSSGEYILFLNAGDTFADSLVLSKAVEYMAAQKADIYYGDVIEVSNERKSFRIYTERNSKIWYYSLGACLCHQSMFCKRKLFQSKLFDLDYIVCADREWQMWHIKNGAVTRAMKFPIAEVLMDGFSGNHIADLEKETESCVRAYCGKWLVVYKTIKLIKKNKFLHKMIQKTEEMISCKE